MKSLIGIWKDTGFYLRDIGIIAEYGAEEWPDMTSVSMMCIWLL